MIDICIRTTTAEVYLIDLCIRTTANKLGGKKAFVNILINAITDYQLEQKETRFLAMWSIIRR